MTYDEALAFIKECTKFGMKLGLERITEILRRLGDPQQKFRAIHIAGTNGKGSTVAMYEAVLQEAGIHTGRYTSPHLSTYRERFVVEGAMIAKTELATLMSELKPVLNSVVADGYGSPTEFEVGTALAFLFFARRQVEIALVEVGMGGRFDATNVLQPMLSVITHIALDHQQYLGDTLEKIAFEKAGIIKPGVPVVIGLQDAGIEAFFTAVAAERQCRYQLASTIATSEIKLSESGTIAQYGNTSLGDLTLGLGLLGEHQVANSLNVISGLPFLAEAGFSITNTQLTNGLAKAQWPSRVERIPTVAPQHFYLDGAHNPDGARALVKTIQAIYPGQQVALLVGIQNNRPLQEMAAIFAPIAASVIVTTVPIPPQNSEPGELAAAFEELGLAVSVEPDQQLALQKVLQTDHRVIVASGSLFLTGLLRSILLQLGD